MSLLTEPTVEEAALELFSGLGFTIFHGPDIGSCELVTERSSYSDLVFVKRLREALARITPKVPTEAIEEGFLTPLAKIQAMARILCRGNFFPRTWTRDR